MRTKPPLGTTYMSVSKLSALIIKRRIRSMALRRTGLKNTSAACAALRSASHHHIAGAYLLRYAQESSWREDNRRVSNGDQVSRVAALAMKRGKSVDFTGYWQ